MYSFVLLFVCLIMGARLVLWIAFGTEGKEEGDCALTSCAVTGCALTGCALTEYNQASAGIHNESRKARVERELQAFLQDPIIPPEECVLKWWATNAVRFPLVAHMARYYLALPATSVPSEQLFSKAGQVITERRNRLKPEHAEQFNSLSSYVIICDYLTDVYVLTVNILG